MTLCLRGHDLELTLTLALTLTLTPTLTLSLTLTLTLTLACGGTISSTSCASQSRYAGLRHTTSWSLVVRSTVGLTSSHSGGPAPRRRQSAPKTVE